jgi:thiol-disulfide isomerase/thioredoxin
VNPRALPLAGLVAALVVIALVVLAGRGEPEAVSDPEPETRATITRPVDTVADVTTPTASTPTTTTSAPTTVPGPDLPDRGLHMELIDVDGWLQSDVTSLEELRGQVVAVQFWTFGCSNCKATLPHLQALYDEFGGGDFEIVGVHAPEFSYEAEVDNIVAAAADLGVTWPIVLDPTKHTFHAWQEGSRAFWPRIYLLDRDGHVRYDHIGEGRYDEIEAAVRALLDEPTT